MNLTAEEAWAVYTYVRSDMYQRETLVKIYERDAALLRRLRIGQGYLRAALHQLGYRHVESWDKRPRCAGGRGYRYGYFEWNTAPRSYDAVVAMHPDGGTDHAVLYACHRAVLGLICPCCITPSAETYWGQHAYSAWCDHLERLARDRGAWTRWEALPISGRNRVLILNG
jgi:hypothetical protein